MFDGFVSKKEKEVMYNLVESTKSNPQKTMTIDFHKNITALVGVGVRLPFHVCLVDVVFKYGISLTHFGKDRYDEEELSFKL